MDSYTDLENLESLDSLSSYSASASVSGAEAGAIALITLLIWFFVFIVMYVVGAILLSMIFKKAGTAQWKAWVPIYNQWKFNEIGGQPGWWLFVPVANIVFMAIAAHNIGKKLGYEAGMTVLYILLTFVWFIIIATSKNQWNESLGAPRLDQPDNNMTYAPAPQFTQPAQGTQEVPQQPTNNPPQQ